MKFEFNSLDELDGFVQYLFKTREHGAHVAGMSPALGAPYGGDTASDALTAALDTVTNAALDIARATGTLPVPDADHTPEQRAAAQAAHAGTPAHQGVGNEPEPPKRKRRTKAEIEADKAAAAGNAQAGSNAGGEQSQPTDAQATAATSPLAGANPFDASTSNEPAATAALNEAPAGATGTLAALGESGTLPALMPDTRGLEPYLSDPADYIALRVAEMGGTFDPREHMKKCVEFIGALGKAKYDEAFTLAGTSRAVASYTPADCAKHIAALEYLQIAG